MGVSGFFAFRFWDEKLPGVLGAFGVVGSWGGFGLCKCGELGFGVWGFGFEGFAAGLGGKAKSVAVGLSRGFKVLGMYSFGVLKLWAYINPRRMIQKSARIFPPPVAGQSGGLLRLLEVCLRRRLADSYGQPTAIGA